MNPGDHFAKIEDFNITHNKRRENEIRRYLDSIQSLAERKSVLRIIKDDLSFLGIEITS